MLAYRIQKAKYAADISGFGSTLVSGRRHQAGKHPILYASGNISLAILECLVHLPTVVKPPDLVLLTIDVPDKNIVKIETKDLPENWDKKGYFDAVQRWGTDWLQSLSSLAIVVPSVTSPDYNILINPGHPDFGSVKIIDTRPITLDDRLI
ncbi:MAG TPA: RES family NAD+ phosphorylase [Chryseolinea sp.]|nr:RES family NAD+ phosphorylase [Chryseolinea sp.]